jgi:hypothetical protein
MNFEAAITPWYLISNVNYKVHGSPKPKTLKKVPFVTDIIREDLHCQNWNQDAKTCKIRAAL